MDPKRSFKLHNDIALSREIISKARDASLYRWKKLLTKALDQEVEWAYPGGNYNFPRCVSDFSYGYLDSLTGYATLCANFFDSLSFPNPLARAQILIYLQYEKMGIDQTCDILFLVFHTFKMAGLGSPPLQSTTWLNCGN